MRVVPAYLLMPGDRVDLLPWALYHPDPVKRDFLYEEGWINRFEQEFCVVREVLFAARVDIHDFTGKVFIRFVSHPSRAFDPDELLPVKVEVAKCPHCGVMHSLAQCESEYGGGVSCDCCRAIRKGR